MATRSRSDLEKTVDEHAVSLLKMDAFMQKSEHSIAGLQASLQAILQKLNGELTTGDQGEIHRNPRSLQRLGKIDFPKFNGEDVDDWIYRCEHFFAIDETPDNFKVRYATINLEGDAVKWHQSFLKLRAIPITDISWPDYSQAIIDRFSTTLFEDAMGNLTSLTQTGTLEDFCKLFDSCLLKVSIAEPYAVSIFLKALKPEIGGPVKMFQPKTLKEAFRLAKIQEATNKSLGVGQSSRSVSISNNGYGGNKNQGVKPPAYTTQLPLLPTPHPSKKLTNTRQISSKEIEGKRARGECFWCPEKFTPGHKCPNKQIYVLEVCGQDEEEDNDPVAVEQEWIDPQISIHALTGIPSFSTMKIMGTIGTMQLRILVDSGSTHNFLNKKLAEKLHCALKTVNNLMSVGVANGQSINCNQYSPNFQWFMQGMWFTTDVLVIPLENYDMVLGVQWLLTLGPIVWNFVDLTMQFQLEDNQCVLKGTESNESVSQAHLFSLQVPSQVSFQHDTTVLNLEQNTQLQSLLDAYQDVFQTPTTLPPKRPPFDHRIDLQAGSKVVNLKPYRYPSAQKDVIEKLTKELIDTGVVRGSSSPFASPVVLVKKKDGTWRFCIDYRSLNSITIKNSYPIPLIEELFDELGGATIFSKLDLRSGYHQIRMHDEDIHKTAFRTHEGLFEFVVMPFGLTNAPATFQSLMNHTFKPFLRKFVLVFFDDILVYSSCWEEHLLHLQQVLDVLRAQTLYTRMSKCSFGGATVEYLGHLISREGVSTDPKKLEAIKEWPIPTNAKQLRGFLGLSGYYRRFIKGYGSLAKPLTNLLRKDAFDWNDEATTAFNSLKTALLSPPVLALPNFSKTFVLETDASGKGIGAVLMQEGHPIAFISKALSARQQALSVYEKELLALIFAVKYWHHYLAMGHFIIRTDQKSLKLLMEQKITTPLQQVWLSKLLGYNFEIVYKAGNDNKVADALSRMHSPTLLTMTLSTFDDNLWTNIQATWTQDPTLSSVLSQLQQGHLCPPFEWKNQALLKKGRVVVGKNEDLQHSIISLCHDSAVGGHSGIHATVQRIKSMFNWKGMLKQVRNFIRQCAVCQKAKYDTQAYPGLLQPLPVPAHVFLKSPWISLGDCQGPKAKM
ncbi:putative nucleotidyltransferase, Ribonuclease H [Helianthus anomalus]